MKRQASWTLPVLLLPVVVLLECSVNEPDGVTSANETAAPSVEEPAGGSATAEPRSGHGWRGPNRDGQVNAFVSPKTWPKQLQRVWQVEVGAGHSSPVVLENRIYQFSRQDEREVLRCLDLAGKEQWKQSYAAPYKMHSAARGHGKGPKSTPWVSKDRIYTLGIHGAFQCRRTGDGALIWQAGDKLPIGSPLYGAATSPLVGRELCIVHLGKHNRGVLLAFDPTDGKLQWSWDDDGPAYTSPVLMEIADTPQIVTQTQKFCISFAASGDVLWKIPFKTGFDQNAITPLQFKDNVIFSGYRKGVTSYRARQDGDAWATEETWHNDEVSMYMSSPVLVGDRLFGFSEKNKGQLFCLNVETGKTLWLGRGRQGANASLLVVGDVVVALLTDGRLIFFSAAADVYQPVAEFHIADSPTWAHPVLLDRKVLIKDATTLAMWALE